ncbi:pentapeptide repeat-containing protein [Leptolyngbya sp. GGD]|uniref:pentapeptide repeat-containing protein n=1 Tax=Leptolyngbya sp. GGD TaxID=2997907 RepID=UPI00227B4A11|nr:pentapeptide repeat-containing protein [Leptolyngbya sp. GGD]MCY6494102.1 pentapeptide repeat-containing protein [Leptolyngbya sp. GGD]
MPDNYCNILAEGVNRWNTWRLENPRIKKPSLRGLRLDQLKGVSHLNNANFRGVDLSKANLARVSLLNADLTGANLSNANLRGAILTGATFNGAILYQSDLSFAELGNANLVRSLLVEANFSHAKMQKVNFRRADLCSAQLDYADLTNADLKSVKALGTSFEKAILTGACIENWHTHSATKLTDVVCDYIYLKERQGERRPSDPNQVFCLGGFGTLFQKALETVDLIFADGIAWQAFFQSFQELRSQYNNLSIQGIEKKSGGAFVIRLEVPPEADKAAIESHAKELYETRLQLQEQRYQAELQAKDGQISLYQEQLEFHRQNNTNLMEIVKTMAEKESPKYDFRGSSIGNFVDTAQAGSQISNVQYVNMSQDLTQAAQQIQDLLQQLQNQGVTVEDAQQQVSTEMAKQAETDPTLMGKMVLWSKAMANKASETTVSEAAKMVLTLALKAAGIPLP